MPELTAEVVRSIVTEAVQGLRTEMHQEFVEVQQEFKQELKRELGSVRQEFSQEIHREVGNLRQEVSDGFERILTTMQTFQDGNNDRFAEIDGRLDYHNKRIAKLERLNGLRV